MASELLQAARDGDRAALDELLQQVQPQVYRFGMRMCRDAADADDILQETMMVLATKLQDFRGESSLSTWVYSIARNECLKRRQKTKRELLGNAKQPAAQDAHVGDHIREVEARDEWAKLADAMESLLPEHKEMLVLRDVEGLSAKEVAQVTGVSVSAAKSRLHRARRALRAVLSPIETKPGCPDILDVFSKDLEGELSATLCRDMQQHLEGCASCTGLCASLRSNLQLCQQAPAAQIPDGLSARIRDELQKML